MTKEGLYIDNNGKENLSQRIDRAVKQMSIANLLSKEDAWSKLSNRIDVVNKADDDHFDWKIRIAAVITLLITFTSILYFSTISISTNSGEHQSLLLPDGSQVELNANSQLSYNQLLWSWQRNVKLEGEAFFEVERGSQFGVHTKNGVVEVLGTGFNVYDRDNTYQVDCYHGKVSVTGKGKVVLTKGYTTYLKGKHLTDPSSFEIINQAPLWTYGRFMYTDEPVANVFNEMERQFGIDITYSGDGARKYTGEFNIPDLKTALDMVCKPMGMTYSQKGIRVTITD